MRSGVPFTKMHGLGNDYIYFDCTHGGPANPSALAVRLSDRHFGVGGDGIVLILPSDKADFGMRMFNADGSEGKMCGNASRCIGKYVYEKNLTRKTEITLETLSGVKRLSLDVRGGRVLSVGVDMGKAELECGKIPVLSDKPRLIGETVRIAGFSAKITCISMGNPHCVVFCDNVEALNLEKIGPEFENSPIFPERVNTEFVEVKSPSHLLMRVWERGSGETMACGTGACAAAVAAAENGVCGRGENITVTLRGGDLDILYRGDGTVVMTGTADFVYDGKLYGECEEW